MYLRSNTCYNTLAGYGGAAPSIEISTYFLLIMC